MKKHLFVGCMPFGFSENDIRRAFEPFGDVDSIELHQDLEHATFDSFANVVIETNDVESLLCELDGKVIGDWPLRVNEVVTRADQREFLEQAVCLGSA